MRKIRSSKRMIQRPMLPPVIGKEFARGFQMDRHFDWSFGPGHVNAQRRAGLPWCPARSCKALVQDAHRALHAFIELAIALLSRLEAIDIAILILARAAQIGF